jgi:FkbM family methyltransferase
MKIGNRKLGLVLSALFERRHYIAARNMFRVYRNPVDVFGRYFLGRGEYPAPIVINTPTSSLTLTVYSYHDVLTVNEVFCRRDYPATAQHRVIVDFGSNIGITAAYFLTSAPNSFVYLYEPLRPNIDRLRDNLRQFGGRYALHEVAVGQADGEVEFGWEDTGRYGGVGIKTGKYVSVTCQDSNKILKEVITRHGRIDILKIDIESLERQVTERIPVAIARNIDEIYVEYNFDSNPLERTHNYRQYGAVAQFVNKEGVRSRSTGNRCITRRWRAGTLESSRSTPIASPQTGLLDSSPCRGSSVECSLITLTTMQP